MNNNNPPNAHSTRRMLASGEELAVICSNDAEPDPAETAARLIRDNLSLSFVELKDRDGRSIFAYCGEDQVNGSESV